MAATAGVPVVATRVGGVPDLLTDGQTGYLVDSEDTAALAEAIQRILDQPAEAQRRAQEARRALSGRFAVDQNVDRYLATYRAVLARKGISVAGQATPAATERVSVRPANDQV